MLFPVEYRALRVDRMPWLCFGLMGLWILASVAWGLGWPAGETTPGVQPEAVTPLAFATHWLWHESWAHVLASLTLLLFVGPTLEETWGRPVFGALIVLGIAMTAGLQLVAPGDPTRPLVGASGLTALLLTAFVVRFRTEGIHYTAVGWWQDWVHTRFWIPSYALLVGWFAFEVLMELVGGGVGPTRGHSYTGQLVGAALGAGLGFAMPTYGWEERLKPERADSPRLALELARLALENEDPPAALAALELALAAEPDDDTLVMRYCEIALEAEAQAKARTVYETRIRSCVKARTFDAAAPLWRRFAPALGRPSIPTRAQLALAGSLKAQAPEEAARLLKAALESPNPTMGLALRVSDLAQDIHAGVATDATRLALELGGDELHETKRARLEGLIEELDARRAALPDPDLDDVTAPLTAEVADPSERNLESEEGEETAVGLGDTSPDDRALDLGFEEDDLSGPPPGFDTERTEPDTPELTDPEPDPLWELDDERPEVDVPRDGPLALSLDGALDASDDEPLASTDYLEPPNSTPDPDAIVPETLPLLGTTGGEAAGELGRAETPRLPPSGAGMSEVDPDPEPEVPPTHVDKVVEEPVSELITNEEIEAAISDSDLGIDLTGDLPRFSNAKRVEVTPTAWESGKIALRRATETPAWLPLAKVQAIGVGAVSGLAAKPVLLIDLLTNWEDVGDDVTLRVVRLRSDRFDPAALFPTASEGTDGFRDILAALLEQTGATPLPDAAGASGTPFERYPDLATYERNVLQLED